MISINAPFALFWMCRVCASGAFQMAGVAVGWLVYERTQSAYALGLVGLCQFFPIVALTFAVGHVADRFDRQRIVAICQAVNAITLGVLAMAAAGEWLSVPTLFGAVAVLGASRAFEHPTLSALLSNIVEPGQLPRAVALSSSAMQAATIAGPSLGGLLYAFAPQVPLAVGCALDALALCATLTLRVRRSASAREATTLRSVFSGLEFIWQRPVILGAISLDLFAVLLGGVTALLPVFARDILHTGPWGLGLLRSAPACGALAMAIVLSRAGLRRRVGPKMFAAVVGFGLATIVFSLSSNLVLSLVALVALGATDTISVVVRTSLVQLSTPNEMRGRVNAVNSLFIGTSNQLGEFESGMLAGLIGAVGSGVVGGIGTVAVAALWWATFPALRRADALSPPLIEAVGADLEAPSAVL